MRVWLDALTPKQARLMTSIYRELQEEHELLVTCRSYAETEEMFLKSGVQFISLGEYGGGDLAGKLISYVERAQALLEIVSNFNPEVLISLSSPEAVRVAFGLGIKIFSLNDTPHAEHVCRLTLPLSDRIIFPEAIPPEHLIRAGACPPALIPYKGVDEVAWMKNVEPSKERPFGEDVVIIRPEESMASYLRSGLLGEVEKVIPICLKKGYRVVVFPRYPEQRKVFVRRFGDSIAVPDRIPDLAPHYHGFTMVITGGGTMAREAALAGTPAISIFPLDVKLYVNDYLAAKGFPIWRFKSGEKAIPLIEEILDDPNSFRVDVTDLLNEMEDPSSIVRRLLMYEDCRAWS